VIGTDLAGPTGLFSKYFPAMEPGLHEISLYGVDPNNRATSIVPLTINAPAYQTTTISNILLSPTVSIHSNSIIKGDPIYATGSAYPGTTVTIFTDTPLRTYTASSSAQGVWNLTINDTDDYNPGDYRLYGLAQTGGGLQSLKSQTLVFSILTSPDDPGGNPCGDISSGDLNCDSQINLTDFSILMYYWGTNDSTADINQDGTVDLTDFSIMMYYWGT
jgi:subtilisin-like proprotein convertase family protein